MVQADAAGRLIAKLHDFVATLDDEERAAMAALILPAVAQAMRDDDDVEGYGLVSWLPTSLPDALAEQIRGKRITISGL